jgi:hypothetical protein
MNAEPTGGIETLLIVIEELIAFTHHRAGATRSVRVEVRRHEVRATPDVQNPPADRLQVERVPDAVIERGGRIESERVNDVGPPIAYHSG